MFFEAIGRTIGDIFGFNKKKREDHRPSNQGGRGVGVLQNRYQQPQRYNRTFQQQAPRQQNPFQKPPPPSVLGQPIRAPEPEAPPRLSQAPLMLNKPPAPVRKPSPPIPTTVPFRPGIVPGAKPAPPPPEPISAVGKFFATNASKLANTGYTGLQGAVGGSMALGNLLSGNKAEANRLTSATLQEMNRSLKKGSGLFGTGGYFKNTQEAANLKPEDYLKKTVAAGLGTVGEVAPVFRGAGAATAAARKGLLNPNYASIAKQSGFVSGLGSAGSQYTETGKIDPLNTAIDTAVGTVLGPAVAGVTSKARFAKPMVGKGLSLAYRGLRNANFPGATDEATNLRPKVSFKQPENFNPVTGITPQVSQGTAYKPQEETSRTPNIPGTKPQVNIPKVQQGTPTSTDYMDQLYKNIGVDTEKGLPKGKITNPNAGMSYLPAQQQLEKLAGNRTQEDILADATSGMRRIPAKINNKTQGAIATAMTNKAGGMAGALMRNQFRPVHGLGELMYGLNKKSTLNEAEKGSLERFLGRRGGMGETLKNQIVTKLDEPFKDMDKETADLSRQKVYTAFEKYNDPGSSDVPNMQGKQKVRMLGEDEKSFTPQEKEYYENIKNLNILRNEINRGGLPDEVIAKGETGMHMPRIIDQKAFEKEFTPDDVETYAISSNKTLDLNPNKRRKQLSELSEELRNNILRDPAQASVIRTEIGLHNRAVREFASDIAAIPNAVSDVKLRGYIKMPDSPRLGELSGKYVRKDLGSHMLQGPDKFESSTMKVIAPLLDKWQSSAIGKLEDYLRQVLTVFNPATRFGNRGANITTAQLAGYNIPEFAVRQQHFMNVLGKGDDEMTRLARTYGAIDNTDALAKYSGVQGQGPGVIGKLQRSYQNTDTGAKVALFEWQLKKGASPEQAARFVNRALPNIGNSGEIYSFFSRLPVMGIPFRAIQPEVYRTLASNATRHTAPFLIALASYTQFQNYTWEDVPEDERKQIQERFGAGQTPFAKLNEFTENNALPDTGKVLPSSWSFNAGKFTGDKGNAYDIDPRRLAGIYSINTSGEGGSGLLDEARKISPAPIPFTMEDNKLSFRPQEVIGSRTFQPAVQALMDRDFRNKSIQDPEGKIYTDKGTLNPFVKRDGTVDVKSDKGRVAEHLIRGYIPQTGEAKNLIDANQDKETFYGQDMTPAQAGLRLVGLKGERFTTEKLKKMRGTAEYHKEKKEIDKQLEGLPKATQDRYKLLTGYYKLREEVPNEFSPGDTRYKKAPVFDFPENKWGEYNSDPKLYDMMESKQEKDSKPKDGKSKPIQPEFDKRLSKEFRKQLINNKSLAPGENLEAEGRMYADPEFDKYEAIKKEYKDKAAKYYPQKDGEFVDELVKHKSAPFPEKGAAKAAYDAANDLYRDGLGPKPTYTDEIGAQKDAYNTAKWEWTNAERKARNLPLIPKEVWDNETFGFDADESEGGYSGSRYASGGGRGGSSGDDLGGSYHSQAISIKSGGEIAKPKVTRKPVKPITFARNKNKPGTKPKVSIRASRV